jgi:hypothetical protein
MLAIRWLAAPSARVLALAVRQPPVRVSTAHMLKASYIAIAIGNAAYLEALAEIHRSCPGHGLDAISVALRWLRSWLRSTMQP